MKKIVLLLFYSFVVSMSVVSAQQEIDNPIAVPVFKYRVKYFQRNDTIFRYLIYPKEGIVDSVICDDKMTRLSGTKWIGQRDPSGSYFVMKFKKVKPSSWFKENNGILFQADRELDFYAFQRFDLDGTVFKYWRFGTFSHAKEIKPEKKEKDPVQ